MDQAFRIFRGLNTRQIGVLRHCGQIRTFAPGELIFNEGDPAYALFSILRGQIEVFKRTHEKTIVLATLDDNDVFGEMGILSDTGLRTAGARAKTEALCFEITPHPIQLLQNAGDAEALIKFTQNLVCILGDRLRQKDTQGAGPVRSAYKPIEGYESDVAGALSTIEAALPKGVFKRIFSDRTLKAGKTLCEQGAEPDGFYFIRRGTLAVLKAEGGGAPRQLAEIHGPTIAGEIGFFSGEKRTATLQAIGEVEYTHFSSGDFRALCEESPEHAFQVVFAAAQIAVQLIVTRESA